MKPAARDELRSVVKEIITSIKPLVDGVEELGDDVPLFDDGPGDPSPVALDSLDTLDLALAIGDRFEVQRGQFDSLLAGEVDIQSLRTVNDIVEFILSVAPQLEAEALGSEAGSRGKN